jgi:chromosome segregation ATPase
VPSASARRIEAVNTRANTAEERLAVSIAEGEALRARIGAIEKERDMLAEALEAARTDLTASQSAVVACQCASDALQATLAEREANLDEATRRTDLLAATLQETQAALLARTTAEERLHSEQSALLRALAAAREVGSAALASLRNEPALVPAASRNAGYLTRFIHLFVAE